ncbi:ABC transporter transmembrane domain-containing protein [uncultured Roseobacter sp.]|uniref:peptidase domain-containing ABC transporter n=1 Tax=uncultured Roseobacter sp. TaxID=114847 RepID=UPI00263271FD|nr:ABC transporter transmembrane domain-containing protein [uncultured Roseobacter sp.]
METVVHPGLGLLQRLMMEAGWHSSERNLTEAAPHLAASISATELLATLHNLDVPVSTAQCSLKEIKKDDCPALFIDKNGDISGVLDAGNKGLLTIRPGQETPVWEEIKRKPGTIVRIERFAPSDEQLSFDDFRTITSGFRGLIPGLVLASFMTNLMGLVTPLLIMMIYDRVIPSDSVSLVISLAVAAGLVLFADAGFRLARSHAVSFMGKTVEHRLGLALFRKLLSLPPDQIKSSEVDQQISRFKQFEGIRDFFSGQSMVTLLDLPFTLIFLGLIFYLAPPVGFLVVGLVVIFAIAIWVTMPVQQSLNMQAARVKAKQQKILFETVRMQRNIYRLGLGDFWKQKNAAVAEEAASASRVARRFQMLCQTFGQSVMMIAGVGAVVLGTVSAMNGSITFGALIAVMALVWKVLTPLQSLYANAPQLAGFLRSREQIDRVLAMPQETVRGAASSHQKRFEGSVALSGVTHRFPEATDPAISQVSLDIAAGEFVSVSGNSSSGKTTLLELTMGLHTPLVGSVQLDGMDIRQIPVDDLRQAFSYAQKKPDVFHGTLLQNFRLSAPTVHEEDIRRVIAAMGLEEELETLTDGLNTRLTEKYRQSLPTSTSRGLALVRTFIRPARVYLLNDPGAGLDYLRKQALSSYLNTLRGSHTVIVASNEPEYVNMADRCIYMSGGRIVANDTGTAGRRKINALIAANREN